MLYKENIISNKQKPSLEKGFSWDVELCCSKSAGGHQDTWPYYQGGSRCPSLRKVIRL